MAAAPERSAVTSRARELVTFARKHGYQRAELIWMIGLTPDIDSVVVVRHGVLRLRFTDGLVGEVDVLDRMRGPVFQQARTPDGFAKVTVDDETGTIVWPGGSDLAPDTLYERVRTGEWPDQAAAA